MAYPSPRRLQLRRGNASAVSTYLGYAGELVVDTTNWTLYVHDGVTVGGYAATVNTASITGNINSILNGTAVFGNIIPSANTVYSLGNITHQWNDLFVSNSTIYVGGVPLGIDATGNLTVNGNVIPTIGYVNTVVANVTVDLSSYALNANVTAANVGLKGYVDQANTIQSAQLTSANLGIIGYINQGNTIQSAQVNAANLAITAANVGMKGYVDASIGNIAPAYSNANVASYLPTYSGNISANISKAGYTWTFGTDGTTTFPSNAILSPINTQFSIQTQTLDTDDNHLNLNSKSVDLYAYNSNADSWAELLLTNTTTTSPTANIYVKAQGGTQVNWAFDSTGTLTTPGTVKTNLISSRSANQRVTIDPDGTTLAYVRVDGWDDGGERVVISNQLTSSLGIYFYTETSTFRMFQNMLGFPDSTWQTTAYSTDAVHTYLATHTDQTFGGNVTIQGNLFVNGNVNYISVNNMAIGDNIINLADLNPADSLDLGFTAHRTVNGVLQHTGLVRDASANQWRLFSNVPQDVGTTVDFTDAVYDDLQLGNITSPTITAINNNIAAANAAIAFANTIQSQQIAAANVGIIGYIDQGNTIQAAAITTANVGMKGYVDFANIIMKAYVDGQIIAANANVSSSYSNVQVATYLPTYSGNIANIRLGLAGVLTFPDGTTQTTAAAGGGTSYSNVNVAAYLATGLSSNIVVTTGAFFVGNVSATTTMQYGAGQGGLLFTKLVGGTGAAIYNLNVVPSAQNYAFSTNGAAVNLNAPTGGGVYTSINNTIVTTVTAGYLNVAGNVSAANVSASYVNVTGNISAANVSAQYLFGDGSNLTNMYSNVNVANYLPSHTGNVGVNYILGTTPNVTLTAGSFNSTFDTLGNVSMPNVYVSGNVVSSYFVGNGAFLTGLPAGFSNVQVAAYLNATGYNLYSNANVASYLPLYGGDISARNITVSGNISLTGNILQINSAIFYGNTITGFSALYAGIPGYTPIPQVVAQFTENYNGYAQINSQNLNLGNQSSTDFVATANNGTDSAYFVDLGIAGGGYDPAVAANNNAIGTALYANDAYLYTAGNTAVNTGGNLVIGVQTLNKNIKFFAGGVNANNVVLTIQGNGITTAGNVTGTYFIGSGQFLTGLPTAYSNVNVQAYTESMGFQNYGNVNVSALITTNGLTNYSNVNVAAYSQTQGYTNYSNVNVAAFTNGLTNYSNVNTAAYLNSQGYNLYSNVNVIAYLAGNITVGNITATYFTGNGAFLTGLPAGYSNVQVATYLPTYSGNVANLTLGPSGVLTFADGTTQTTASTGGGSNYSNVNVAAYLNTQGYNLYSNVNVASYLGTGQVTVSNIKLAASGNIVFADGTVLNSASSVGGNYSNVNVAVYLPTYGGTIQSSNVQTTTANIQATTAATNPATGALRVMGGVGVAGAVVAAQLNSTGNVLANAISAYSLNTVANVTASVVNAGTINSTGNVLAQNIIGTIATASQPSITAVGTLATLSVTGNATVGNLVGSEANTRIIANTYVTTFDIYGNVAFPGNITVGGLGVTMPTRPAFRVNGTSLYGGAQSTANVNLKGVAVSTAYNQGSYFDATTGKFTAPIAGIYEVLLNARVNGSFNGLAQLVVLKNGLNSAGNIVAFWETTSNTAGATHFGVSGTVVLATGDYLSANILVGNVTFDQNDNWSVTYLG